MDIDFGSLIPVVAILSSLGFAWIHYQHQRLKVTARGSTAEADDLRAENRRLAERIATLERIAVDRPSALSREIDALDPRPTQPERLS